MSVSSRISYLTAEMQPLIGWGRDHPLCAASTALAFLAVVSLWSKTLGK
jgi:hypothetical protein